MNPEDVCPDCEYTPSGWFAYPCTKHGCPSCWHLIHPAYDCGAPDSITGWCECADGLDSEAELV